MCVIVFVAVIDKHESATLVVDLFIKSIKALVNF